MAMPKHMQAESHAYDFRKEMNKEHERRGGKKKHMMRTEIEHHDNGGHTVKHFHDGGMMMPGEPPETHAFENGEHMMAHMHSKFGGAGAAGGPKPDMTGGGEEGPDEDMEA